MKELIIMTRYQWKNKDRFCYKVRATNPLDIGEMIGSDIETVCIAERRYMVYQVLVENKVVRSCTCPAFKTCHHKASIQALHDAEQVLEEEIARLAAPLALPATTLVPLNRVRSMPVIAGVRRGVQHKEVVDLGARGTLNGARVLLLNNRKSA